MTRAPILSVFCLAGGLAVGVLYGSHASPARAAIPHAVAKTCPPPITLTTLSSRGDVATQDHTFSARGHVTITWDSHNANLKNHNNWFWVDISMSNGSKLWGITNGPFIGGHDKGSSTVLGDCSRGCFLYINSNMAYRVTLTQ